MLHYLHQCLPIVLQYFCHGKSIGTETICFFFFLPPTLSLCLTFDLLLSVVYSSKAYDFNATIFFIPTFSLCCKIYIPHIDMFLSLYSIIISLLLSKCWVRETSLKLSLAAFIDDEPSYSCPHNCILSRYRYQILYDAAETIILAIDFRCCHLSKVEKFFT